MEKTQVDVNIRIWDMTLRHNARTTQPRTRSRTKKKEKKREPHESSNEIWTIKRAVIRSMHKYKVLGKKK